MQQPESLWQQHQGKALAELHRGCGYALQTLPVDLEPPYEPYDYRAVNVWDCVFNGWEGPFDGSLFKANGEVVHRHDQPYVLPTAPWVDMDETDIETLVPIVVEQFPDDEATIPKALQFLLSLTAVRRPVSFEVLGLGRQPDYGLPNGRDILIARRENRRPLAWAEPSITVQFVADRADAHQVQSQLLAHYPNSAVVVGKELSYAADLVPGHDIMHGQGFGSPILLESGHAWPIRTYSKLDTDPLGVAVAAMENLGPFDWALLQILFQPAKHDWASNAHDAAIQPYKPKEFIFSDLSRKVLDAKFSTPLFTVAIRVLALCKPVHQHLLGWVEQFTAPPQRFMPVGDENEGDFGWAATARCSFRPGLLLNAEELASLVHLPGPSVVSERLRRVKTRTRRAVDTRPHPGSVVLGDNVHQGVRKVARIPAVLRTRHCYVAGASGTGKSTLLLNMILQDIHAGCGVGVLDPHGDLVNAVLRRIPAHRVDDVILFDPADEEHPFALNILEAADETERERIVSETLMALEKYFPASWGPRLERILTYTIHTVLHAIPGATLADVERMLTDEPFRRDVLAKTTDARFVQFWNEQFRFFPKNATDPVLNKLSVFLTSRTVRNIICQRRSAIDFDALVNGGKILLANLSTGMLTEKIAGMLGSFLVTKIVNAAFRRAKLPDEQRRPWYLYVDEFQAFMNLSVGFDRILAEARKYKLVLSGLANQYVGQLSPAVRAAIFGNVGTFIVFRLGVDDANIVAKEMGIFTADEILYLELGQAIARAGGSATSFNIETYPEPPLDSTDPSERIRALTRQRFTRPRVQIDAELGHIGEHLQTDDLTVKRPEGLRQSRSRGQPKHDSADDIELTDPSEDDLVT